MQTLLIFLAITLTTNGGVVLPKHQSSTEEEPENGASLNAWSGMRENEPIVTPLMDYDRNLVDKPDESAHATYFAPMHIYVADYHSAVGNNGQHYERTNLDHHRYDDHQESYLPYLLDLKVKEATAAAEARAKEATEKEAILAKWKAEEAELINKLKEQQAQFDALKAKYEEGKHKKIIQETKYMVGKDTFTSKWEPSYTKKEDMTTTQDKRHPENMEKGTTSFSTAMTMNTAEGKSLFYLPAQVDTKDGYSAAIDKYNNDEVGKMNTFSTADSKSYAALEAEIALLKAKNELASFTPSEVSSELVKPYDGPLASLYVLPSGYLADTDEVFAAKQSHLRALMEAESAAAQWEKHSE